MLFVSSGAQNRWKIAVSGDTLKNKFPNLKNKFPGKFITTQSIFAILPTDKNDKTVSLKVFKMMDFKTFQHETKKGNLRP